VPDFVTRDGRDGTSPLVRPESFRVYDEVGADGYPPEWHDTIKHAVREAAGHRCVRCLHPYEKGDGEWSQCDWQCSHSDPIRIRFLFGETWHEMPIAEIVEGKDDATAGDLVQNLEAPMFVEAAWRILTVHHLNGNKADCRWWNLVSLCQRCHLRVQRVVLMERVWPWEHSEWFKPYVAGYYAHAYLGEEITREQAVERMDELLALERSA
jgi:hypothetical protein